MKRTIALLFLAGCSGSASPVVVNNLLPSPDGQDAAVDVQPPIDAGADVSVVEDAGLDAAQPEVDSGSDVSTDGDNPDVSPIVDAAKDVAAIDAHDASPDHVGSVWCATPIGLYVGCDGQVHYDFDMTTPNATCPSGKGAIASCSPGDQCVVHLTADNTYHVGTCQ